MYQGVSRYIEKVKKIAFNLKSIDCLEFLNLKKCIDFILNLFSMSECLLETDIEYNYYIMFANIHNSQTKRNCAWHNNKDMYGNLKVRIGVKIMCIILCTLEFIYQTQQLVELYMSGKTIAENRVERLAYSQLPAITICLPTFMDMELFAELKLRNSNHPEHIKLYNEFKEVKNISQTEWSPLAHEKQGDVFWTMLWEVFFGSQITLKEIFDEISVNITVNNDGTFAFNETGQVIPLPLSKIVSRVERVVAESYTIR